MNPYVNKLAAIAYKHDVILSFAAVAIISLIGCIALYLSSGGLFYADTDCYTRALRIIDWLQNFQWPEKIFPYFNPAGNGFELHFTRICDVIWLVLSSPFMLFFPLKQAVFYGGMLFSPLFMVLSLIMILWGLKPYLPKLKNEQILFTLFALMALCLLGKLSNIFSFQRPDHHSLMCFTACCALAVILRNPLKSETKYLFWLGILCGCGIWASSAIEGLFVVAVVLTSLSVNRIFYRHDGKELLYFGIGLFLSVLAAWLINPPLGGWQIIDINRLSIVHVVLTATMMLAFWALAWFKPESKLRHICGFGIAAAICMILMLSIFGTDRLLTSIYHQDVYSVFIHRISEMQHQGWTEYEMPSFILGTLIMAVLLYVSRGKQAYVVHLLIFFTYFTVAALLYKRFYPYYIAAFVFLYGIGLFLLMYGSTKSEKNKFLALIYILLPIFYLNTFYTAPQNPKIPPMKETALINLFYAPQLVFFQNIDTVGGPYHTNIEGIVDNHTLWFSDDEAEIISLLKKHNVHSIYVKYDEETEPEKHTDQLFGKIMSGKNLYPWLIKIDDGHYEVDYNKLK